MSVLVDIWTSELAKLREKGQILWSTGSSPINYNNTSNPAELSSKVVQAEGRDLQAMTKSSANTFKGMRVKSTGLAYSDASLSLLFDCFCA